MQTLPSANNWQERAMQSAVSAACEGCCHLQESLASSALSQTVSTLHPHNTRQQRCSNLLHLRIPAALNCSSFQVFHHSLLTVTIVFCWGELAWHSLTYVQLFTCQTCLLPCVVWVKRRDSVCHSTRRQPLLQRWCAIEKSQSCEPPPCSPRLVSSRRITRGHKIHRHDLSTVGDLSSVT